MSEIQIMTYTYNKLSLATELCSLDTDLRMKISHDENIVIKKKTCIVIFSSSKKINTRICIELNIILKRMHEYRNTRTIMCWKKRIENISPEKIGLKNCPKKH